MNITSRKVNDSDLNFLSLSYCDPIGKLFKYEGRLYRGITKNWTESILEIFSNGLLENLVQENLFPKSKIADIYSDKYPLIIEHEYIKYISYSTEWTFEMLKRAAIATVRVNEICNNYGYEIKDAHSDNIVYDRYNPIFVDLGSIVKKNIMNDSWTAIERFYQSFIYPMGIWKYCGEYLARRSLVGNSYMPHATYFLTIHMWARLLNPSKLSKMLDIWNQYKKLDSMSEEEIGRKVEHLPFVVKIVFKALYFLRLIPVRRKQMAKLNHLTSRIRRKTPFSTWSNYHTTVVSEVGTVSTYPRFIEIIQVLKKYSCRTIVELGANQAELSRMILSQLDVKHICCLDIDEGALDIGYIKNSSLKLNISHALIDIMSPTITYPKEYPHKRFKGEAVVALAISHHLILGQNHDMDTVISSISKYTTKYALIEFMPHGFDLSFQGKGVPEWYTEDMFKSSFEKIFAILERKKLEENRILYVGELRATIN